MKPHPDSAVQFFIETSSNPEDIFEARNKLPKRMPRKANATLRLYEASHNLFPLEEATKLAEEGLNDESHPDLHLLLLICWHRILAFRETDASLLSLLGKRIESLLADETPPEVRAWGFVAAAHTAAQAGDIRKCERLLSSLTNDLSPDSPHYPRVHLFQMRQNCLLGKGQGVRSTLIELESTLPPQDRLRIASCRLVNEALIGNLEQALALLPAIKGDQSSVMQDHRSRIEVASYTVQLMAEFYGRNQHPIPNTVKEALEREEPAWVISTRLLLLHRPEEALEWARRHFAKPYLPARTVVGFDEYCLIRAELSVGHWKSAERLLLQRFELGAEHYFDDFFVARVKLQSGALEQGREAFRRLHHAVSRYGAEGRLDFETRLACELKVSDLLLLAETEKRTRKRTPEGQQRGVAPQPVYGVECLVGESKELLDTRERILQYAQFEVPVLITGPTGSGKELVARALHEESPRQKHPFLAINCAAISETIIESELFGHERGAFTGASKLHRGLFRDAEAGTLFLDEIGEISPRLQVALLRVLENREVRPVGSSKDYPISCRIVAATNANLEELTAERRFRSDLLFRLKRLEIELPALCDRPEDIIPLALHFLNENRAVGHVATISSAFRSAILSYPWPGNVRELRYAIERLRLLNSDKLVYDIEDLPRALPSIDLGHLKESTIPEPSPNLAARVEADSAQSTPPQATHTYLAKNTALRRRQRLEKLFDEIKELKVNEAAEYLGVSRITASKDLKALCEEGFLEKVEPTRSRASHYYRVR